MSERHRIVDRVSFDLEERLGGQELDQLEGVLRDEIEIRDETLSELHQQNLTIRTERDALKRRIETVEQERLDLENRIEELETNHLRFEPENVVADFGSVLDAAGAGGYAVSDFRVDLRTNVVSTDEGVRLQFPTPLEDVDARNLSTLSFAVGRRPEVGDAGSEYREVPAVEGLQRTTAEQHLAESDLAVGEIEFEEAERADIVLWQFPEPYVLAEPGTEIDLVVSNAPKPGPEEPGPDESDEPDAEEAELRVIDGIGPRRAERLRAERILDLRTLLETDPEHIADVAGVSTGQAELWLAQARELQ